MVHVFLLGPLFYSRRRRVKAKPCGRQTAPALTPLRRLYKQALREKLGE